MSVNVPVFLVDRLGNKDADNINCSPCIDVVVVGGLKAFRAVALLDSGATGIYADPLVIAKAGMPQTGMDTYHAVGVTKISAIHSGVFWIDQLPDLPVSVQAAGLRSEGKPYDLILGRSFLTLFDFGFDLRNKAWKLVLPGQPISKAENSNRLLAADFS